MNYDFYLMEPGDLAIPREHHCRIMNYDFYLMEPGDLAIPPGSIRIMNYNLMEPGDLAIPGSIIGSIIRYALNRPDAGTAF